MSGSQNTPPQDRADRRDARTYTRRRLLVGGVALVVPMAIVQRLRATSAGSAAPLPPVAPPAAPSSTTLPTAAPTASSTPAPADIIPSIARRLGLDDTGDDVVLLQRRMTQLGFDPGPIDGMFGPATRAAVWAAEKLLLGTQRSEASGMITPAMWQQLQQPSTIAPRRPSGGLGDHTEIYLPEQIIIVFHADRPVLVSHMSSGELDEHGEPAEWCDVVTIDTDSRGNPLDEPVQKDICGRSKTPGGVFEYYRRVDGWRNGALGSMWNPVYFNYGIAVHGAVNVPLHPASHGCVRIPMHIADRFPDLVADGDPVLVWDGTTEPEQLTDDEQLPVFDYPNPNATTTTSTTTPLPSTTAPTQATTTTTSPNTSAPPAADSATTTTSITP